MNTARNLSFAARSFAVILASAAMSSQALARDIDVSSGSELSRALQTARPGDRILLREGEWTNLTFTVDRGGTPKEPITVAAKVPGQTFLTGQSAVRLAGSNIVLADLIFRDGYSPTSVVINVRANDDLYHPRNNRITGVVIENFSKPNINDKDNWISLTGYDHRVDHSAFIGKTNEGPTLVVRMDLDEGKPNRHRIEQNYFGYRPPFGDNGAETIRVGASTDVDQSAQTRIYRNLFERTNGEAEAVSLKARDIIVEENTFYEVLGALTFRHGGHNSAIRNVFFGNNLANTGGIRLTGPDHTVTGNYFEGVRGTGYLGVLAIMSGQANASSSEYRPVERASISGNSYFNSRRLTLAVGASSTLSVPPSDTQVTGNLFGGNRIVEVREYASTDGISFSGNLASTEAQLAPQYAETQPMISQRAANGLYYSYINGQRVSSGAPSDLNPVTREEVGPAYYTKPSL